MKSEQIILLQDKVRLWRREAIEGNMEMRDYNRRCADALEDLLGNGGIAIARDCFLNMIADAQRFDEDVDGDEVNGRTVITINYHLTVGHYQLEELCEALGIKAKRYDETLKDAIDKAIDAPVSTERTSDNG